TSPDGLREPLHVAVLLDEQFLGSFVSSRENETKTPGKVPVPKVEGDRTHPVRVSRIHRDDREGDVRSNEAVRRDVPDREVRENPSARLLTGNQAPVALEHVGNQGGLVAHSAAPFVFSAALVRIASMKSRRLSGTSNGGT